MEMDMVGDVIRLDPPTRAARISPDRMASQAMCRQISDDAHAALTVMLANAVSKEMPIMHTP
jgi:hypothetical protein